MAEIAVDHGLLQNVDRNVRLAIQNINVVQGQVVAVQGNLARAQERIKQLRAYVEEMRREQRNAAALQRAISEIIRVRQELEQKFGKYQEVRDSMIGILQANDHALVNPETITKVSEELMISTPKYWLAPCVIAIAAWIANDQTLAKRAVEEALSRDAEKTALLMALICRRSASVSDKGKNEIKGDINALQENRLDASRLWLKFYFNCQDPKNISRSVLLFANAYVNGVFGDTQDNEIDDIIQNKWLPQLAGGDDEESASNFKDAQISIWDRLFTNTMTSSGTPATKKYPNLAKFADKKDFENISAYADRVDISENFIEDYFLEINSRAVDTNHIVEIIDEYMTSLVTDFDEVECALREEEERYQIIKEFNGDTDVANAYIKLKQQKKKKLSESVSLIKYLNDAVAGNNTDDGVAHDVSEQKTALKFTKPYIQESYNHFMDEKKDAFPAEVKANVEGVNHTIKSEADTSVFSNKVKTHLEEEREAKKAATKPNLVMPIIVAIIGVILFAVNAGLAIVVIIVAAAFFGVSFANVNKAKKALDEEYDKRITASMATIKLLVKEWTTVSSDVARFNSKPRFDVGSVR